MGCCSSSPNRASPRRRRSPLRHLLPRALISFPGGSHRRISSIRRRAQGRGEEWTSAGDERRGVAAEKRRREDSDGNRPVTSSHVQRPPSLVLAASTPFASTRCAAAELGMQWCGWRRGGAGIGEVEASTGLGSSPRGPENEGDTNDRAWLPLAAGPACISPTRH
jgi:hypothetical protein